MVVPQQTQLQLYSLSLLVHLLACCRQVCGDCCLSQAETQAVSDSVMRV